jgi:hypothetical protein
MGLVFCVKGTVFAEGPSDVELKALQQWFRENPPNGKNRAERLEKMQSLQAVTDLCVKPDMKRAFVEWNTLDEAPTSSIGALKYLYSSLDDAVKEIHESHVTHGVVAWYLYNMGFVFKTPDACFGVDICMPGADRLVKDLDFTLITHSHQDHYNAKLAHAMIAAGKPFVSNFYEGGMIVTESKELHFGKIRVKIDIGDHTPSDPARCNNMLMYQIDCGPSSGDFTIYHSGDGANYDKMTPDKAVDLFIPHVACSGMKVADAMRHVHPKTTLVSHVMELSHDIGGARWRFDFANDEVKDFPENEAVILTWGERWASPGAEYFLNVGK